MENIRGGEKPSETIAVFVPFSRSILLYYSSTTTDVSDDAVEERFLVADNFLCRGYLLLVIIQ